MAIKNKEGGVFSLSKPNPIMISQSLWSKDEIATLHGKFGKKVLIEEVVVIPEKVESVPKEEFEIWCLPAYYESKEDPLYGDTHAVKKYGNKFIFKGSIIEAEDLYIVISCSDDRVTEGSVIFPKNKDRRWWHISRKAKLPDGIILQGTVSDYQPSFV